MEGSTPADDAATRSGIDPNQLRSEIEAARLQLYFQPIVSLSDRSATALEALPRWPHPVRGIPRARRLHRSRPRERPARAAGALGDRGRLRAALPLDERRRRPADDLAQSLRGAPLRGGPRSSRAGRRRAARREGRAARLRDLRAPLIEAGGRSLEKLRALAELGVSLTIDDYRGSVSSELLRGLPTNALKISRQIVAGIPDDTRSVEAAAAAIAIGQELDLAVIASGVEDPGQLASLRDLGCRYAQGFLISLPMPVEVLEERMAPR